MDDARDEVGSDARVAAGLSELLRATAATLAAGGAKDEAIGELRPPRRILLVTRPAVMEPIGRAWRLGVLLIDREGRLYATGKITRAVVPGHPTWLSASVEQRRADRLAASRGRFASGEVINYDVTELPIDSDSLRSGSGPIALRDGEPVVRLATGGTVSLAAYLADRVEVMNTNWDPWQEHPPTTGKNGA